MRDINIICNESENENFLFFAEFFKLCGIYVIKSVRKPYNELDESKGYIPESILDIRREYKWLDDRENEALLLQRMLRVLCKNNNETYSELTELSNIYLCNNLMVYSMLERYFYVPSQKRLEECLEKFQTAYKNIKMLRQQERRIHVQYFMLVCQHKINMLLGKLRRKKKFDSRELIRNAIGLYGIDPEQNFYQGFVLAGIIADGDLMYLTQSITYYRRALQCTKEKEPIRAYIVYRVGRYYEKVVCDEGKAWEAYNKAYDLAPSNYRILFKKAFIELDEGYIWQDRIYIELARKDFHRLYLLLYKDLINNNLEPIQLEYLTKTYKNLYEIYDLWMDNKANANQILEEISNLDRVIYMDTFFDNIFQIESKARTEREFLIQHLDIKGYKNPDSIIIDGNKHKRGNKTNAG